MKVADFNLAMRRIFLGAEGNQFNINVTSFGFLNMEFQVNQDIMGGCGRILNPYYVKSLKKLTGNKKIVNYVFKSDLANEFVDKYHALLKDLTLTSTRASII